MQFKLFLKLILLKAYFPPKVKNENIQLVLLCSLDEVQLDESFIPSKSYMNEKWGFQKKEGEACISRAKRAGTAAAAAHGWADGRPARPATPRECAPPEGLWTWKAILSVPGFPKQESLKNSFCQA